MVRKFAQPISLTFPRAPREYSQTQLNELIRNLEFTLNILKNPGQARHATLTLTNLTGDARDLEAGAVYYTDDGTLKIALEGVSYVLGESMATTTGSVTVTTV
jgi:hypothetical protein